MTTFPAQETIASNFNDKFSMASKKTNTFLSNLTHLIFSPFKKQNIIYHVRVNNTYTIFKRSFPFTYWLPVIITEPISILRYSLIETDFKVTKTKPEKLPSSVKIESIFQCNIFKHFHKQSLFNLISQDLISKLFHILSIFGRKVRWETQI